jgi:hypothetical protein
MIRFTLLTLAAALCGISSPFVTVTHAAVITQGSGQTYIAYETEDDVTINGGWTEIISTSASSNAALTSSSGGGNGKGNNAWFQHTLEFATAGTYSFYLRHQTPTSANNNVFRASDFNVDPGGTSFDNLQPGPNANYKWTPALGSYTIDATSGASDREVGDEITFTMKYQEDGFVADRIVFSTNDSLTDAQLDALSNSIPEPASLVLLAAGGLLMLPRRQRI